MQIRWLGTAASEGWPALFCACEHCREAERRGAREIRTRSGALIDDVLLIDLNPDLYHQKLTQGLDLSKVRDVLITHGHTDHFQPSHLSFLRPGYAHIKDRVSLRVWASEAVLSQIPAYDKTGEVYAPREVVPGDTVETAAHRVTVLPAEHGAPQAQCYLIRREGVSFLYAHDTGGLSPEAWAILGAALAGKPLDGASLDCTNGPLDQANYGGHMGFRENIALREALIRAGMATEKTSFFSNHFSHNGGVLYREACARMEPYGIGIAFDGMVARF